MALLRFADQRGGPILESAQAGPNLFQRSQNLPTSSPKGPKSSIACKQTLINLKSAYTSVHNFYIMYIHTKKNYIQYRLYISYHISYNIYIYASDMIFIIFCFFLLTVHARHRAGALYADALSPLKRNDHPTLDEASCHIHIDIYTYMYIYIYLYIYVYA